MKGKGTQRRKMNMRNLGIKTPNVSPPPSCTLLNTIMRVIRRQFFLHRLPFLFMISPFVVSPTKVRDTTTLLVIHPRKLDYSRTFVVGVMTWLFIRIVYGLKARRRRISATKKKGVFNYRMDHQVERLK